MFNTWLSLFYVMSYPIIFMAPIYLVWHGNKIKHTEATCWAQSAFPSWSEFTADFHLQLGINWNQIVYIKDN